MNISNQSNGRQTMKGYKKAFIVAFKSGKKIKLKDDVNDLQKA